MTVLPVSVSTEARQDEQPPATNGLLKPREAARILCICERTLWALDRSGEIPRINIGRAVRYDAADLYAWIERQKR
ncbi:MAG: helix-turn-helix domain-containing protein [Planctomycetes bacterium]|nr:helix-turn-helix domain-containing protein [Planctomycetota bacterium]